MFECADKAKYPLVRDRFLDQTQLSEVARSTGGRSRRRSYGEKIPPKVEMICQNYQK